MRRIIFSLIVALYCLWPLPTYALELTDEEIAKVKEAEKYMNNISTMTADFVQISPYNKSGASNISVSYGRLFLNRPGKATWEYTIPTPMRITINDHKVAYHDKELDQISYTNIEGDIGAILTNDNINFLNGKFELIGFKDDALGYSFTLQDIKKEQEGKRKKTEQLMLTFLTDPIRLHMFKYKDINGYITTLELKRHQYNMQLDDELFTVKNPRIGKDAWDRK